MNDDFIKKLFNNSYAIPITAILAGGLTLNSFSGSDTDILKIESELMKVNNNTISDFSSSTIENKLYKKVNFSFHKDQASLTIVKKENFYPDGNPPFVDLTRSRKSNKNKKFKLDDASLSLRSELNALKLDKANKQKKTLPRSLNDPVKRGKAIKMLADTYQVFNRDIEVASQVVKDAIDNSTRTEKEISEAVEAIEHMKNGRRMVIEKIRTIEEVDTGEVSSDDSENYSEEVDQFITPEDDE